ncbi:unnamed protein product [Moneuplotes crassus]|uniref:Uncharacterized protein n=1 Tax=Euplotes crassus TaxID=5936 RepID=A0AAD1X5F5_EUPCR|nr:unnamed protein product [Moneuplotes crassus]
MLILCCRKCLYKYQSQYISKHISTYAENCSFSTFMSSWPFGHSKGSTTKSCHCISNSNKDEPC